MFQKRDFLLIAIIFFMIVVSAGLILFFGRNAGETVYITIDGRLYGTYRLSQNQTITVEEPFGFNKITIENGMVHMAEADCPDKYCMAYKPIKNGGQTIICLPHKLVVEVIGKRDSQQVDVIVP